MTTTSGYTKKDYIAVRRGAIYCAPFCGGKCTWAEFQLATKRAEALCKKLGSGWEPRVHENLGWHSGVVYAGGYMSVAIHDCNDGTISYSAFLNTDKSPGGRWYGTASTPEKAIKEARTRFNAELSSLQSLQERLKAVP